MKRWSAHYVVQRATTRDYALDLGKANMQLAVLINIIDSRDIALNAANAERIKWQEGYNKEHPLLQKCQADAAKLKTWAWIGKGGALVAVVVVIVKGIAYLTRPLP